MAKIEINTFNSFEINTYYFTLRLSRLCSADASYGRQGGHGGVADEGPQAVLVPGQNAHSLHTGQLTGGLQLPGQEAKHQLPKTLKTNTLSIHYAMMLAICFCSGYWTSIISTL